MDSKVPNPKYKQYFMEYADRVYRFAYLKVLDKEKAEDVTSEVFRKMLEQDNLKEETVKAWLLTVARNQLFDGFRKNKGKQFEDIEDFEHTEAEESNYEKELLNEQLIEEVRLQLENLDPEVREVIALKIWEEMTFVEIGEVLGMSESNAKYRYYKGIEQIKASLPDYEEKQKSRKLVAMAILPLGTSPFYLPKQEFINTSSNLLFTTSQMTKTIPLTTMLLSVVATGGVAIVLGFAAGQAAANNTSATQSSSATSSTSSAEITSSEQAATTTSSTTASSTPNGDTNDRKNVNVRFLSSEGFYDSQTNEYILDEVTLSLIDFKGSTYRAASESVWALPNYERELKIVNEDFELYIAKGYYDDLPPASEYDAAINNAELGKIVRSERAVYLNGEDVSKYQFAYERCESNDNGQRCVQRPIVAAPSQLMIYCYGNVEMCDEVVESINVESSRKIRLEDKSS